MPPPGIIEPLIETVAVAVRPEGADRLPELLLVALGDREDAMRRTGVVGFGRHGLVLSIVSPPQWRPRCPLQGRGGKAGLSQVARRPPHGAELHQRSAEASGFDQQRAPRQNRAQREDASLAGSGEFERTMTDEIGLAPQVSSQAQRRVRTGGRAARRLRHLNELINIRFLCCIPMMSRPIQMVGKTSKRHPDPERQ
jgi:hypothetical protein